MENYIRNYEAEAIIRAKALWLYLKGRENGN